MQQHTLTAKNGTNFPAMPFAQSVLKAISSSLIPSFERESEAQERHYFKN
jgi:hypothetical protein